MAKNNTDTHQPEADLSPSDKSTPKAGRMVMALDADAAPRYAAAAGAPEANAQRGLVVTREGVAVIPVSGFMSTRAVLTPWGVMGGRTRRVAQQVQEAAANNDISAIVLHVDSPGGSVEGVTEAAAVIRQARESKRVIAVADTMAGSAAYWLAAQADELVVAPSGEVGSIGVFMLHEDWSQANAQAGVVTTYIHAGANKVEANGDEPLSETARAHLQETVEEYYTQFVSDVATGRGIAEDVVRGERFGEGRSYPARMAVERGLADRVGTLMDVVRSAPEGARDVTAHRRAGASAILPPPRGNFAF